MSSRQLEKIYEPQAVEARWSQYWLDQGYFAGNSDAPGDAYTIVIPPPNVTGSLHIGHALNNTLQDILIRWRRMQGRKALWVPGTDHAGIATQNVVERQLHAEGSSREQLGRDAFIERVWKWRQESGDTIIGQLKHLGASCDWSRLRFTMDDGLSKAVREVFVRLHQEGLIYRGERLINWCPRCLTALSDIEVEHEQLKGKLYHIQYPLADDPNVFLTIATTRPETLLGDTAVAVHPEDPRYNHLIGKSIRLPLTSRTIPIVGDAILVDREFGTGAVKITPAHDFNDFDAGERHQLPRLSILNYHAQLDPAALEKAGVEISLRSQLANLPVAKARPIVIEALQALERMPSIDDHQMALGKCYRCKTVVEPFLSPQWFVKIQPLADPAIQAVETGQIRIIPEGWANNYLGWMRGIKDWCISRQIWWGHRIPAWYCTTCYPEVKQVDQGAGSSIIPPNATPTVDRVAPKICPTCSNEDFIQDPDVLDTWFSSALWPFSTLGWPEDTQDLKTFYPTATLVTGLDILFFWVARMIMMGLKFTGKPPFKDVYIHALVRDAEGQKMSKSKGNVIDPLTKMSQYGTDALRFTLTSMASPGRDIKLSEERIEGYRNFTNKIWNAARFILMNADGKIQALPFKDRPLIDRWILTRLNQVTDSVNISLENYRFDQAANQLYHFIWHEYCDWYLELIKPSLQADDTPENRSTRYTLFESFEIVQRLLHPLMPFLTEEIWQAIPHEGDSLVIQSYPQKNNDWVDPNAEEAFRIIEQVVTITRTGRALLEYGPAKKLSLSATAKDPQDVAQLQTLKPHIEQLTRGKLGVSNQTDWPMNHVLQLVAGSFTVGIHIEGEVDLKKALDRIKKQTQTKHKEATRLQGRLASPDFTAKAEPEVIQESQDRLNALNSELSLLSSSELQLQKMVT
ncbi:valine--tRNA ligase [Candidatus Nitronereus thalassa]|uniref:Valine--tRNA ligase n=1 Tax=Candidatus Nitronereus thalassa TaxID=3020898 RepID=A0ABU3K3X8_9BACT|nr:valine--tRNA ligase [Candidatus Nitronereus thalassa]MDT7041099.1 valine--tRNA ligase [Candidatus Nitronereus thalassa]